MTYDTKNIYFKSNFGDIVMDYGEAFEIAYTTLDAMIGVGDDRVSELLGEMNRDKYGEIINGIHTYVEIADKLKNDGSVIIGWTDEKYTHLDILFTYGAYKENGNILQRGLRGNDLFVSIIGLGSFGFEVTKQEKAKGYVAEKLNLKGEPTLSKFTDLVNGVIKELYK